MARPYTDGIAVRSVSGRIGDITMRYSKDERWKRYPVYMTIPKGAKRAEVFYSIPKKLAAAILEDWRKAHPKVDRRTKAYRDYRDSVFAEVCRRFTGMWAGPGKHVAKQAGQKGPAGAKGVAHVKKESYPPQTDPATPWWTSPPTFKAECHAQRIADVTYQGFTEEIRLAWRRECTPAYKTPYDVYQHQAITRLVRGIPVPPEPPARAGWKIRKLQQDLAYWQDQTPKYKWAYPDESCQTWGLAMVHVAFAIQHWWDGFKWQERPATLWSLYADVGLEPEADKGFITPTIYAGPAGDGQSKTFQRVWWPEMEANPITHDIMAQSASVLWQPAARDGSGDLIEPRIPDTAKGITMKVNTTRWSWYHYRLPYPSRKCNRKNMRDYIREWPDTADCYFVEYA